MKKYFRFCRKCGEKITGVKQPDSFSQYTGEELYIYSFSCKNKLETSDLHDHFKEDEGETFRVDAIMENLKEK